jgi:hypothetical protein
MPALSTIQAAHDDGGLFLLAILICAVAFLLPVVALGSAAKALRLPALYFVFTFFAFTCMIDAVLSLSALGLTDWGTFYLESGEAYLGGMHGAWINGWDATGHYALYLLFTYHYATRNSPASSSSWPKLSASAFRLALLWWAGSVLNSLVVLLPAVAVGSFGVEVRPSILLNIPYVALPITLAWTAAAGHVEAAGASATASSSTPSLLARVLDPATRTGIATGDALFSILLLPALVAFLVVRALAAGGASHPLFAGYASSFEPYLLDPTRFPLLQAVVYALYYAPVLLAAAVLAFREGSIARVGARYPLLAAVTVFLAGGAAQGQVSYVGAWVSGAKEEQAPLVPAAVLANIVAVGLAPQILAWRMVGGNANE